ncbi:peptidylprolyl isomerase [Winogradskyella maritima]|uniref:peptidylprolyl isomerase n=1 Tax=Winogradskyella maritima TaxID=1517766 RepID=A0ABV8AHI3_9FLAO|nr:peptidylprolyl isomerase [Winogradskyella maritima]
MIKRILLPLALVILLGYTTSCKTQYQDLDDGLYAEFVTTKDTMIAKLFYDKVPLTVANFVALAEGTHPLAEEQYKGKPFYDGLTFHRVMDQFMIQGGDPTGTGSGTPGYRFTADFDPDLKHDKPGILSMANSGGMDTNGSQFFITEVPYPSLDAFDAEGNMKNCGAPRVSCHSVFGELVKGIEVQDAISNVQVGARNKPVEDVVITKLNIIRIGSDAKKFDAAEVFNEQLPLVEGKIEAIKEEQRAKAEAEQKAKEEKIKEAAATFKPTIDDYKSKAKTTESGMQYYTLKEGTGPKPKTGESVMVNYEGYFADGRILDSNVKSVEERYGAVNPMKEQRGMYAPTPMTISPDAPLFAGFKEALASMKIGEKTFFYFPSHIAYGESGRAPLVAPNTDLAFIIELVEMAK